MTLLYLGILFSQVFNSFAPAFAEGSPTSVAERDTTSALNFAASKWIWTSTAKANAFVAFRKDFTPPLGKSLIGAEIIVTADSVLNFYVNGDYIGSGTPVHRYGFAHRFCVDLPPSYNVFSANASTVSTAGGLLATILLTYSDGSTDTLVTDSSWRVNSGLPLGFEQFSNRRASTCEGEEWLVLFSERNCCSFTTWQMFQELNPLPFPLLRLFQEVDFIDLPDGTFRAACRLTWQAGKHETMSVSDSPSVAAIRSTWTGDSASMVRRQSG